MLLVLVIGWASFYNLGIYFVAPGQALPVASMINVQGGRLPRTSGRLLMTDVTLGPVTPAEWVFDHLNSSISYLPASEIVGTSSQTSFTDSQLSEMADAKLSASVAALEFAGESVDMKSGAYVAGVIPGTPADGKLKVGDVIYAVNGRSVSTAEAFVAAFSKLKPGQTVQLMLLRSTGTTQSSVSKTVAVTLGASSVNRAKALLGIEFEGGTAYTLPRKISISSGSIGGPSAGLAFALGILEQLGKVHLPAGEVVAATGTISPTGQVGDVGGVRQKTITVISAGAVVFLVPPQEYSVAVAASHGRIKVVAVSSLRQAVKVLESLH